MFQNQTEKLKVEKAAQALAELLVLIIEEAKKEKGVEPSSGDIKKIIHKII